MSKRYFLNNFDTFLGKAIISELLKEIPEEPTLMSTYKDVSKVEKPKGFKKILKREKPKLFRKKMLEECDVYLYDLNESSVSDVNFVVEALKNATLEESKVLVLVSNIMVWAQTPRKEKPPPPPAEENQENPEGNANQEEERKAENTENNQNEQENNENKEENEGNHEEENEENKENIEDIPVPVEPPKEYIPFTEEHYKDRVSHPDYQTIKDLEDLCLSLQKENLKVVVVCAGVLYGQGEIFLHSYFQAAWLQQPQELPYLFEGDNKIPMIHVTDLAKFLIKISESPPENLSYVLAIDNAKVKTQKGIIEAISQGVGNSKVCSVDNHEMIKPEFREILTVDLDMLPSKLLVDEENPPDFEWTCQNGVAANTSKLLKEFTEFMSD